ncbi:winged helix DNA-binding domain-containing protein [Streptomyces sp. NPDC058045]|uniref:winged helix DNA-binding domain-containing protein n=1 Tax=Streptomyces sp. NPDC058045 TaxID=3346311 RepID=UPI0036E9F09B
MTTLDARALNRATLARQLMLRRATLPAVDAVARLVGLQAQNVRPPYVALAARLEGFRPEELSEAMADRRVARLVTMRSTLHTHTAADALTLRPFVRVAPERELTPFRRGLAGVDLKELAVRVRALVEEEPRDMGQLRAALASYHPDADPHSLVMAARSVLPLVQVTPRGLWRRSGQVVLTTAEHWFGRPAGEPVRPEDAVRRYLAAFGPASVKDMQNWAGVTRLRPHFEALREELLVLRDEHGTELFDLPEAPRPAPDTEAPVRLLPEYDNLLLGHADRSRLVPEKYRGWNAVRNGALPALMVDGFLAGVWKLAEKRGEAVITVEPFGDLDAGQRAAVTEEAARMLSVLAEPDADHRVEFGTVRRMK